MEEHVLNIGTMGEEELQFLYVVLSQPNLSSSIRAIEKMDDETRQKCLHMLHNVRALHDPNQDYEVNLTRYCKSMGKYPLKGDAYIEISIRRIVQETHGIRRIIYSSTFYVRDHVVCSMDDSIMTSPRQISVTYNDICQQSISHLENRPHFIRPLVDSLISAPLDSIEGSVSMFELILDLYKSLHFEEIALANRIGAYIHVMCLKQRAQSQYIDDALFNFLTHPKIEQYFSHKLYIDIDGFVIHGSSVTIFEKVDNSTYKIVDKDSPIYARCMLYLRLYD